MRVAMLLLQLPQAEQTAEHVAAPQQEAPKVMRVLALGRARSGRESRAPILAALQYVLGWRRGRYL